MGTMFLLVRSSCDPYRQRIPLRGGSATPVAVPPPGRLRHLGGAFAHQSGQQGPTRCRTCGALVGAVDEAMD